MINGLHLSNRYYPVAIWSPDLYGAGHPEFASLVDERKEFKLPCCSSYQ